MIVDVQSDGSDIEAVRAVKATDSAALATPIEILKSQMRQRVLNLPLTAKQAEIAIGVALGESNQKVADKVGVTMKTVKFHLTRIFKQLGVKTRVQLSLLLVGHDTRPVEVTKLETK